MENQRIRLSKKMLKDALIRVLRNGDIQEISIHAICQEAQINRTTFYKYYGSQYDLLNDIEKDVFNELEVRLSEYESINPTDNEGLAQTLAYFEDEREKCLLLINSTTDKEFAEKLFDLPIIQNLIRKNMPQQYTEEHVKYIRTFVTHGGYAMIRQWINAEKRESPKEMTQLLQMMLSKLLLL